MKAEKAKNKMREIKIEKVSLNIGGTGEKLDKGQILLEKITGKKPVRIKASKRIPDWNVRPGLEVGIKVTLRGEEAEKVLERTLQAVSNKVKEKQIQKNFLSFGIKEYIDIPGMEYLREVGIIGLEVTVVFIRSGKRIERKKIKRGKTRRQDISPEEISEFMLNKFKTQTLKKIRRTE